jgi:hypothetical protein
MVHLGVSGVELSCKAKVADHVCLRSCEKMGLDPIEQFREEVRSNFRGVGNLAVPCLLLALLRCADISFSSQPRKLRDHSTLQIV